MKDSSSGSRIDRRKWLQMAGALGIGGLAGCSSNTGGDGGDGGGDGGDGGDGGGDGGSGEPIRIGTNFPQSGAFSQMGLESQRGLEMAVKEINNNGGANGRTVELDIRDNASSADQGVSNVEAFATSDIDVVMGSFSSSIAAASSQAAAKHDLPYFELNGFANSISEPGLKNVYHVSARADNFGNAGGQIIDNVVTDALDESIRLAVMHESGEYGNSAREAVTAQAEDRGYEIVETIEYAPSTNDLSSSIQRLKDADPNVLYHAGYGPDTQLLWSQAQDLDWYVPVAIGNGTAYNLSTLLDAAGKQTTLGLIGLDAPCFNTATDFAPGSKKVRDMYVEEYDEVPFSLMSFVSYTAGKQVIENVLAEIDSYDLDTLEEAALNAEVPVGTGANGWGLNFDEEYHRNQNATVSGMQWQEDNYTDDHWHPDRDDETLDVYTVMPDEGVFDFVDLKNIPRPDYTE